MLWHIVGVDRDSGEDLTLSVEADSAELAELWAARRRMLVNEVRPSAGEPARAEPVTAVVARVVPPPSTLPSRIPMRRTLPARYPLAQVPKGVSGLGLASLVLGIIACLFAWVPIIGLFVVPIAAMGVALAAVGFLISLVGGRSSVGMPFAGGVVSGLALFLALGGAVGLYRALTASLAGGSSTATVLESDRNSVEPIPTFSRHQGEVAIGHWSARIPMAGRQEMIDKNDLRSNPGYRNQGDIEHQIDLERRVRRGEVIEGPFYVVWLHLGNVGSMPSRPPKLVLVDALGRSFEPHFVPLAADHRFDRWDTLNPGTDRFYVLPFEMADDPGGSLSLRFIDDAGGTMGDIVLR